MTGIVLTEEKGLLRIPPDQVFKLIRALMAKFLKEFFNKWNVFIKITGQFLKVIEKSATFQIGIPEEKETITGMEDKQFNELLDWIKGKIAERIKKLKEAIETIKKYATLKEASLTVKIPDIIENFIGLSVSIVLKKKS